MVFFVVSVRVPLLLWTLLISSTSSDKIKGKLTDANLITNFLRQIVIPYLETNQHNNGKRREHPGDNKVLATQVETAIRQKLIELKPMLQHREHIQIKPKINVKSDENDKATILELMSGNNREINFKSLLRNTQQETNTLNNEIEKYKQKRQHIKFLLHKEKTSSSTSELITRTLDDMLDLLIERKCQWNNLNTADVVNFLLKNSRNSKGPNNLMCYLRPGKPDIHILTGYGPPELSPHMKSSDITVARENEMKDMNLCDTFIICSKALTNFLKITYHHLNDTAVSTFTNYAAMYVRDVKEEFNSVSDDVSSELEYLSNLAKNKVNQIFLQELEHFTLDETKDKTQDIAQLKYFLKATAAHIKSSIYRVINSELSAMKSKLYLTMKDDLSVNLRMDIDNLIRLLETNICRFFVLCNNITQRRTKISKKKLPTLRQNAENSYDMRHSFGDKLQNSSDHVGDQHLNSWQEQTIRSHVIKPKQYSFVNVTRKTVRSIATVEGVISNEKGSTDKFFK